MNLKLNTFAEYQKAYKESVEHPQTFWGNIAQSFTWNKKWDQVLEYDFNEANANWYIGGKLNITENILDRHLEKNADKIAFYFEPNHPEEDSTSITYQQLYNEVCKMANGLKSLGVEKGDRIAIYMPMVLESIIATLACARIGAVHSIVFAGFSSNALRDRIIDANAKVVLTADGLRRGEKTIPLKEIVDQATKDLDFVEKIVTRRVTNQKINTNELIDIDYDELVKNQPTHCLPEIMNSEDILFILYTSGSTGKPKGVVHTCGGYMVYTAYSFQNVFQPEKEDVFWCTADIGWITGHSYIIYGPLLSGVTSVVFEGIPTYPHPGRFWEICEKYKVNQFYTAPTAIRALMTFGNNHPEKYNLDQLKVIGSVGEPINEEAWNWYNEVIGKRKCAVVDTWWQTETGGILISGLGSLSPSKPTYAGLPLPGIQPVLMNQTGEEIKENNVEGLLCIQFPWPSMIRTTYGDHDRCKNVYFSAFKNKYFTGDGAKRDSNGLYRIIGRVDDVINVSGHRFGTAEIEDSINTNKYAVESAVVGYPHAIKGQGIYAYVVIDDECQISTKELNDSIQQSVIDGIGRIAKPDFIQRVNELPKTRSGKIMRRILRKIASNETANFGDTSTLLNPNVVEEIMNDRLCQ